MFCPRCGEESVEGARFCACCGTEIGTGFTLAELESRPIVVEVLSGPSAGRRKELSQTEVMVGRELTCDLALLKESQVSARHCRLVAHEGALWVEDLRSTNGTYVNGRRVVRHRLAAGDELRLGPDGTRLKAVLSQPVVSSAAVSPSTTSTTSPSVEAEVGPGGEATGHLGDVTAETRWQAVTSALARVWHMARAPFRATAALLRELPDLVPMPAVARTPARLFVRAVPWLITAIVVWLGVRHAGAARQHLGLAIARFQTDREMALYVERLAVRFRADGTLPDNIQLYLGQSFPVPIGKSPWQDHFGGEYWLEKMWGDGAHADMVIGFYFSSPGPDGKRGSDDDIVRSYRPPNWEELAKRSSR